MPLPVKLIGSKTCFYYIIDLIPFPCTQNDALIKMVVQLFFSIKCLKGIIATLEVLQLINSF